MLLKDSGMRIRVERELREAFVQACRDQNRAASEVLRDFMRSFTQQRQEASDGVLSGPSRKRR